MQAEQARPLGFIGLRLFWYCLNKQSPALMTKTGLCVFLAAAQSHTDELTSADTDGQGLG